MRYVELQNQLIQAGVDQVQGNYDEAERLSHHILESLSNLSGEHEAHSEWIALKAGATRLLGIVSTQRSDYTQALEFFNTSMHVSQQINDQASVARVLSDIGNIYGHLSDYSRALEFYGKALGIAEEVEDMALVATILSNMGLVHESLGDYSMALVYSGKSLSIAEEIGYKLSVAISLSNIGNVHNSLSDYPKALEYYGKALSTANELGNKPGVATDLGNIGNVYFSLSDYPKALEYHIKALSIDEDVGNKSGVAKHLINIGNVYASLSDYPLALEYYGKALGISQQLGNRSIVAITLGNIGTVYTHLSDYPKALEYYGKALALAEESGIKADVAVHLSNIGGVYKELSNDAKALEYYSRALKMQEELGNRKEESQTRAALGELYALSTNPGRDDAKAEAYLRETMALSHELGTKHYLAHKTLAELYERQERWQEANNEWKHYHSVKEEVQSEEAKKSADLIEQKRHIAEREKEITIAKAIADAQMSATTKLLYKVLPQSVATRMINGDEEIADYYPQVSILFADIAGFTPISADMPAIIVVRFLNYVFAEFDRIIKKHGCEKIKTIGDGYMAVAGAPIESADHAERLAAAALEMQETITLPESIREYMPSNVKLGVRIGLHTGSVVAGVIGEERFVYDIYSDAVNTAARMESHGEENKIHVSNDFFRHLQNRFAMTKNTTHGFVFEKRGEMEIKGKGMMRTYFLERSQV